ncbi:2-amino-3,7-dideoxy-D-threo-hept-6-ulosonate synthase [Halomicroarcula limicola]|uniref:2-amino-3,7-dideoxy-D-threo-hept-6-ulosonate synthase n=1 Tax=Haloarcula limicola TaxID=1429915 RepID=A0A8J7Y477_9EURY|nr:2-amino-3,7-dideoxy-D-threo-hept-6-ulosonate synthase [Halomicroarcula limicola]MBV0923707.1 2-amino-3,7-dideoxy-D-threo-hept-6-ulosonate synthase [Halomicroarcula limicola]
MNAGKRTRLDRIGTDGRYVVVPMDHGITMGAVTGLKDIESTIDAVTRGGADAVLTQRGIAGRVHPNKNDAGYIAHLNGSTSIGPDEDDKRRTGTVEDAIRAGADAVSFHINVGSEYEREQIAGLAELTGEAERYGLPVLAMTYARGPEIDPEAAEFNQAVGHAVRLGEELGADVVKTAYTGDAETFQHVVESTSLPVVIAGGSRGTDQETLQMVRGAMDAGAAGVSMGRSIFQHEDPEKITRAVANVVHDDSEAADALRDAGLAVEA